MLVASLASFASQFDAYELRLDLPRTVPIILTVRKKSQGGQFQGSEEERLNLILSALALEPDFVDIEWDTDPCFIKEVARSFPQVKIIISYHNYENTPDDLDAILERLQSRFAFAYKVATKAHDIRDAFRMLAWIKKHAHKKVTGICMGPDGEITRILGKAFGNFFSYTSWGEKKVEPSQIQASTLLENYRLGENLQRYYALIGGSIENSISAFVHNDMFKNLSLAALYVKLRLETFHEFFPMAKDLGFVGFSVTMPLKEKILPYLNALDEEALKIGAVNTVKWENGLWKGYNTDGQGALNAIETHCKVKHRKMLIIGTGGAAKAIGYEAIKRGACVQYLSRAKKTGMTHTFDILVNASPSPLPLTLEKGQGIVMDINTMPILTPFLQMAQERGYTIIFGYKMFVQQAILQYHIWEDISCNVEILEKTWLNHAKLFSSR